MLKKPVFWFAVTLFTLSTLGCDSGGSSTNTETITNPEPCSGFLQTGVVVPKSCGQAVEDAFFSEHFKLISIYSIDTGEDRYTFDRSLISAGVFEVEDYDYSSTLNTYSYTPPSTPTVSNHRIQNASGQWVTLHSPALSSGVADAAVAGDDGNEYPLRLVSPDDPNFELLVHIKDIVEGDISGITYDEARFSDAYTGGINDRFPPDSKAYGARIVLKSAVNDRYYSVTDTTSYASLQEFAAAYTSQWFCLRNGYGVQFDSANNQVLMVNANQGTDSCVPESGAVPLPLDLSTQTFNGVNFLVISGENLTGTAYTVFGATTSKYPILISVSGNIIDMAYHISAESVFTYLPGFGVYLNRTALNSMLVSFGQAEAP